MALYRLRLGEIKGEPVSRFERDEIVPVDG
jgi:hypothetical protein